ncbi:MAG: molybdate ABC transporter substrate-binding protein [Octadecabacter sp.]|nr:molybdate ABC transporter substrate-binding protein [Octadecabacter sp.]
MNIYADTMSFLQRLTGFLCHYLLLTFFSFMAYPSVAQAEINPLSITVFAASSLRDALSDVAQQYTIETGKKVILVFAASSKIARQVADAAPADVVLLADQDWSDWLVTQGAVAQMTAFVGNQLVLVGREHAPIGDSQDIEAALGDGVLAMALVDAVPAGRYGKAALLSLGIWDDIALRVVQAANVRAALWFVERGEAPLGIGYASDLVALPILTQVYVFAPDTHPDIIYSGANVTLKGADFMAYLQSVVAQETLVNWGFVNLSVAQ